MLDIKKVKQMLENGEEVRLECVDIEGLLRKNKHVSKDWKNEVEKGIIKVLEVDEVCGRVSFADPSNVGAFLLYEDLKHFRIAEAKQTFDDLIDVAIQAYKDGVIKSLKLLDYGVHSLSYSVNGDENTIFSQHKDYSDDINSINSLYTETFVIEGFHDTKALKKGDKAVLGNGEEVIFSNRTGVNGALWFEYNDCHRAIIPFIALKGATVTQKKGNK